MDTLNSALIVVGDYTAKYDHIRQLARPVRMYYLDNHDIPRP
jgi:hypothetical protein